VPYLVSGLAAAVGVVVLAALLVRLAGCARRAAEAAALTRAHITDRASLLTARVAALRVQVDQRRRPRKVESSGA
jgi:hypothetical protein